MNKKPTAKFNGDFLLAADWRISGVRNALRAKNRAGLIEFIRQRHRERFFDPIQRLRDAEGNQQGYGFAMMALCSLLIETIQSYREGLPTTDGRELGRLRALRVPADYAIPPGPQANGTKAFRRFFSRFRNEFDGMSGLKFYRNVRCGLLHQGQTKRGWTIAINKPALYANKVIDRNRFASRLDDAFESYLAELGNRQWDTVVWRNARRKIWWLIRLS